MKETEMSEVEEAKPNRRNGKTAELLAKVETLIRSHQIVYVFSAKELKDLLGRNSKITEIALRIMVEVFCTHNRPFMREEIEKISLVEDVIKYVKEQALKAIKIENKDEKNG